MARSFYVNTSSSLHYDRSIIAFCVWNCLNHKSLDNYIRRLDIFFYILLLLIYVQVLYSWIIHKKCLQQKQYTLVVLVILLDNGFKFIFFTILEIDITIEIIIVFINHKYTIFYIASMDVICGFVIKIITSNVFTCNVFLKVLYILLVQFTAITFWYMLNKILISQQTNSYNFCVWLYNSTIHS